jgi:hypothetical protein
MGDTGNLKDLIKEIELQKETFNVWAKNTFQRFHKDRLNLTEKEMNNLLYYVVSLRETSLPEIEMLSNEERLLRFGSNNTMGYKFKVFGQLSNGIVPVDVLIIPSQWFLESIIDTDILNACSELN